ncbi:hypothetical protein GR158_14220 [Shinella sp. AETb1-6]|jgi:hypothetical protein|uniref:Uncharacterized protein n=2 Tax=Shinella TaxID=323620 RepID=A0AA50D5U4_9HYPH|nr:MULTISPECIES: hypothetical protein [Shinella]MDP9591668.1 hypothetical protein [Shinella zoogloeoides]MCD1262972.1 hypothetical protein [Shinella sumterensis]MXN52276.1 hypothetical protein [Shinella sp. AETb1-6]WLR97601.1 hypothetical protein Q9313_00790 [Shinella sumterensis]WLS03267.1 hypothetical protein Q9315_01090 [Shinella oryzae]
MILTKSRVGGHPQARATLGSTGDKKNRCRNQELFLRGAIENNPPATTFAKLAFDGTFFYDRRPKRRLQPQAAPAIQRHVYLSGDTWTL